MCIRDSPKEGEVVYLRENSNISTGGDSIDFTDDIDDSYKAIAVEAAKALHVKITGCLLYTSCLYDGRCRAIITGSNLTQKSNDMETDWYLFWHSCFLHYTCLLYTSVSGQTVPAAVFHLCCG